MNWLRGLWGKLVSLPIGRILRPFWQAALVHLVDVIGNDLKERLKMAISNGGPSSLDKIIDEAQLKMQTAINKITFLPESYRLKISSFVQDWGDDLQSKINLGFEERGPAIIDLAFHTTTEILIARIKSL